MIMNRRKFLIRSANGLTTLVALPVLPYLFRSSFGARADDSPALPPHFMLTLAIPGGLDATLGLDPQIMPKGADTRDMFIEYRPEDIIEASGLRFGPSAAPLKEFASSIAVVNGLMMRRDVGHDSLRAYMASGDLTQKYGAFSAEMAMLRKDSPIGMIMAGQTYSSSSYMGARNLLITSTDDLSSTALETNAGALQEVVGDPIGTDSEARSTEKSYLELVQLQPRLTDAIKKISGGADKPEPQDIVAAAFSSGMSCEGLIEFNQENDTDSHSNHEKRHLAAQKKAWESVTKVFNAFKRTDYLGQSLFDQTTFFIVTEFSRTPALNYDLGKDHNPSTNSILLAGKGVPGGKTFGQSRLIPRGQTADGMPLHIGCAFNYDTGAIAQSRAEAQGYIYPENVIRSLVDIFGNPPGFESVKSSVPLIPGWKKS